MRYKFHFLIALILVALLPIKSYASTESSVQVIPAIYSTEINPGETQSASLSIINKNDTILNYTIDVENLDNVNQDGTPNFSVSKNKDIDVASWLKIDELDGTVPANQSKKKSARSPKRKSKRLPKRKCLT